MLKSLHFTHFWAIFNCFFFWTILNSTCKRHKTHQYFFLLVYILLTDFKPLPSFFSYQSISFYFIPKPFSDNFKQCHKTYPKFLIDTEIMNLLYTVLGFVNMFSSHFSFHYIKGRHSKAQRSSDWPLNPFPFNRQRDKFEKASLKQKWKVFS